MPSNISPSTNYTDDRCRNSCEKRRKFNPPGTMNYNLREEVDKPRGDDAYRPGMMTEELMHAYVNNMERISRSLPDQQVELDKDDYMLPLGGNVSENYHPEVYALSASLFEEDPFSSSSVSVSNVSLVSPADKNHDRLADVCFYNRTCPSIDLEQVHDQGNGGINENGSNRGGYRSPDFNSGSQVMSSIMYESRSFSKDNPSNLNNGESNKITPVPVYSKYVNNVSNANLKNYSSAFEKPCDASPRVIPRGEHEMRCSFPCMPRREDNENRCSFTTVTNSSFSSIAESNDTLRDAYRNRSDLSQNISRNDVDLLKMIKSISPRYVNELISSVNSREDNIGSSNISPLRPDQDHSRLRNEDSRLIARDEESSLNARNEDIPFSAINGSLAAYNTSQSISYNSDNKILKDDLKSTIGYGNNYGNEPPSPTRERIPFFSTPEEIQQNNSSNNWQAGRSIEHASTQNDRYDASMQGDRYNSLIQEDRHKASTEGDRCKPSMQDDRYKASTQDDGYRGQASGVCESEYHVKKNRKEGACINSHIEYRELPLRKKDTTYSPAKSNVGDKIDADRYTWGTTTMPPTKEADMFLPATSNQKIEATLARSSVKHANTSQPPFPTVAEGELKPYVFSGNMSNSRTSNQQVRMQEDIKQNRPSYCITKENSNTIKPYGVTKDTNMPISAACSTESAGMHQRRVSGHMHIPSRDVPVPKKQSLKSILKERLASRANVDTDSTSYAINKTDSEISILTSITEQCISKDDNTQSVCGPFKSLARKDETNDQLRTRIDNNALCKRKPGPYSFGSVPVNGNTYKVSQNTDSISQRKGPKALENDRDQTQSEIVNNTIIVQMGRKGRHPSRKKSSTDFNVDEQLYSTVNGVKVPISGGTIWKYNDTHLGKDQLDMSVTVSNKGSGLSLYSSGSSCTTPATTSESESSVKNETLRKPVYSYSSTSSSNNSDREEYNLAQVRRRNNRTLKRSNQRNRVQFSSELDEDDVPSKQQPLEMTSTGDGFVGNDVINKTPNQNIEHAYTFKPENLNTAQRDHSDNMVNSRTHWSLRNKVTAWAARISSGRHSKESEVFNSSCCQNKNTKRETTSRGAEYTFLNADTRHSWPTNKEVGAWPTKEAFEQAGGIWPSQGDNDKESSSSFRRDFVAFRQSSCGNEVRREESKSKMNVQSPGGGVKETRWAITQVTIFHDGSKTYSVTKPTKRKPCVIPAKIVKVFVTVPRKRE